MNAVRARLYLVIPVAEIASDDALDRFLPVFTAAIEAGDVACVLIRTAGLDDRQARKAIGKLAPAAHAKDIAVLVEDRADLAAELHCDGLHVTAGKTNLKAVRAALGEDMILGINCGDSRHDAMIAGENGADYIAFNAEESELLGWWAELMEIPCVAWPHADEKTAEALARQHVEFVALEQEVWASADTAAAMVVAYNEAFSRQAS